MKSGAPLYSWHLLIVALVTLGAFPSLAQPATQKPPEEQGFTLDGLVKQRRHWNTAELAFLPRVSRKVSFTTGHGDHSAQFSGVSLWALIEQGGIVGEGEHPDLHHTLTITGRDGYWIVLSLGEIDPLFGDKPALIAYQEGDKPLQDLRLIVPGDRHGARDVRDVVHIEVK